jgi:SAM-dependent methyltransferase
MDGTTTELEALKTRLRAVWTAGDFGEIASVMETGSEEFVSRLALKPGARVLDVACGNGNSAIPAARAGADVTGIDIAPYLIEKAVARAKKAGVRASFDVGDAESLPYEDDTFDAVISMFGAMFAPRPDVTADELKRVCCSGGTIAMANWTPEGFIGQMFKVTGKHVAPPKGLQSPVLWGDEAAVQQRFGSGIAELRTERRDFLFVFPFGPADVVEHFRRFYGPTQKAFAALDEGGQAELRGDLEELWAVNNLATNDTTAVNAEYLEIKAIKA